MILPVALEVANRRVLIVGGGNVAARKAKAFFECGALVVVVSPDLIADFPLLDHRAKQYETSDLNGFQLVCACTNSASVNAQIARDAKAKNIWCNIADAPADSDFHTSAVVRRGEIAIGISSGAVSPVLSRHLKEKIESCIGLEYAELIEIAAHLEIPIESRGAFWRAALQSEALELLRSDEKKAAAKALETVFKSLSSRK